MADKVVDQEGKVATCQKHFLPGRSFEWIFSGRQKKAGVVILCMQGLVIFPFYYLWLIQKSHPHSRKIEEVIQFPPGQQAGVSFPAGAFSPTVSHCVLKLLRVWRHPVHCHLERVTFEGLSTEPGSWLFLNMIWTLDIPRRSQRSQNVPRRLGVLPSLSTGAASIFAMQPTSYMVFLSLSFIQNPFKFLHPDWV